MSEIVEEWRPIPGYEGRYEVSSVGRVKSFAHCGGKTNREPRILKPGLAGAYKDKYLKVSLGRNTYRSIHRLVLEAFVGPRPPGMQCRHLDGNTLNNTLGNLAWGTIEENIQDKIRHGRTKGEKHWNATLSEKDVIEIRSRLAKKDTTLSIANDYHVTRTTIQNIRSNKIWTHIPLTPPTVKRNKFLTYEEKLEIKGRLLAGEKIKHLMVEYGVCYSTIWDIKSGRIKL